MRVCEGVSVGACVHVCVCVAEGMCEGVNVFMGVNARGYVSVCVTVRVCQQRVTGSE